MKELLSAAEATFGSTIVAIVLIFIGVTSAASILLKLREAVVNVLGKKDAYETEKRRLELVKLHYEIEAIRKSNGLEQNMPPEYALSQLRMRLRRQQTEISFKPAIAPKTILDWFLIPITSVFMFLLLIALPSFVIAYATDSKSIGLISYGFLMFVLASVVVLRITVGETGIRFVRLFGSPRFLEWSDIESIALVTNPWEVFLHGWLWPPFPPHEASPSMTLLGHYKITWKDGFCYFPPRDMRAFEATIAKYLANRGTSPVDSSDKGDDLSDLTLRSSETAQKRAAP